MKRRGESPQWEQIVTSDGNYRGEYRVDGGVLYVRSQDGKTKTGHAGGSPPAVVARIILSELRQAS